MVNNQPNPGHSLTGTFPLRQLFLFKIWLERAYRLHVYRYGNWHGSDYRLVVWMTVATTFIVLAAVCACVARTDYLRHQEQSEVANARHFLALGEYALASSSAGKALAQNPADLLACRVMADANSLGHFPTEMYWVQRLADIAPTTENKLRLAEAGLRCQSAPYPISTVILTDLAETSANNPVFQMLAGNLAAALHEPTDADAHFVAAVQLDPANEQYTLRLATFQLGSANLAVKNQARQQLEKLAPDSQVGLAALRALVADREVSGDDAAANHYSDQLLASPQATMADRLQNLAILHRINQDAFSDRLAAVMERAANQAELVAQLSTWMQANGLAAENLAWLSNLPKSIRSEQSYKMALAQDYLQTGRWQDMLDAANRDNWSDQDFLRLAMISRAWSQLGVPTVAQSNWGEAVKKAGDHYESMTNLLGLAERWQLSDAQQDLRQRILQLAPQ